MMRRPSAGKKASNRRQDRSVQISAGQSPKSTPNKRKRNPSAASKSLANVSVRQVHVNPQKTSRWQHPRITTMAFVMELIETNIEETLGDIDPEDYEEVQDTLNRLRQRLKTRFGKLKVPPPHVTDYNNLHKIGKAINREISANMEQMERIQEAIDNTDKHTAKLERRKKKLEQAAPPAEKENPEDQMELKKNKDEALISTLEALISGMEQFGS